VNNRQKNRLRLPVISSRNRGNAGFSAHVFEYAFFAVLSVQRCFVDRRQSRDIAHKQRFTQGGKALFGEIK
jgi:hypothetical protein